MRAVILYIVLMLGTLTMIGSEADFADRLVRLYVVSYDPL